MYNRRYLERRLAEEIARCARSGGAFTVVMLDLDFFKEINDGYGHPAGDEVLRQVVARMTATLRAGDVLCRYGGDEFVALLLDTSPPAAQAAVERLRREVAGRPLEVGGAALSVAVSCGVAAYPVHGTTGEELLAAADAAMYRAKQGGPDATG